MLIEISKIDYPIHLQHLHAWGQKINITQYSITIYTFWKEIIISFLDTFNDTYLQSALGPGGGNYSSSPLTVRGRLYPHQHQPIIGSTTMHMKRRRSHFTHLPKITKPIRYVGFKKIFSFIVSEKHCYKTFINVHKWKLK